MSDIIKLLPDSIANQIAAGEVIQRPASAVKEMLENAVDAGATSINLVVKDAGKTLIQVIDNGCGMSDTDARMAFERHATSKIRETDDLFNIRTKGFRGEALASIAAIAQVELKSKRTGDELATKVDIEGSKVSNQEPCGAPEGTSISVKNLFYNVPARRKFLKSDPVEMRHITDEFHRVALAHPDIAFSLHHNNNELFHLEPGSFRQRIVGIFGKAYNQRLVPVEEETSILKISGFVGKPEFARKTRGEQYFFVNQRFIKNNYLHHAIQAAFDELIPARSHPSYFLFLTIDPGSVDVNIHPTKTEVKFTEERAIYAIIRSAVRQALGSNNIAPSLDFEQETSFNVAPPAKNAEIKPPTITVNPNFNPFDAPQPDLRGGQPSAPRPTQRELHNREHWQTAFASLETIEQPESQQSRLRMDADEAVAPQPETKDSNKPNLLPSRLAWQLHGKYIVTSIRSGLLLVHQQRAHERILYEAYAQSIGENQGHSQQLLFPKTIELPASDAALVSELTDELHSLGFDIEDFGKNSFILRGLPAEAANADGTMLLESVLEAFKVNSDDLQLEKQEALARSMAFNAAIRPGTQLQLEEMNNLIDRLFACEMPYASPSGKPTITTLSIEDIDNRFNS